MIDDIFGYEELPNLKIYKAAQAVIKDFMDREYKKIEWVAEKLGTTKGYLYAQLEPNRTDKPLSVDRIMAITELTGDTRIIEAMAKEFGYTLCKPETESQKSDDPVIAVTLKAFGLEEVQGILAKTIKESIADGVLDEEEKSKINETAHLLRKLAAELQESLK
ncbi:phage regulatory CII family protein [Nitrosophilus kaiyonis]|uniref:phage regulatory CII family protein n=1 Tax=Nitrosophilus kaiyonis TaxID=2930200 RepID=UPI0024931746|nr:phage regulatory CII family protein [Nitrosophilus kaiyonis]